MKFDTIFKSIISPVLVGIVVLLGQLYIQPIISARQTKETKIWLTKQMTYLNALEVLDQKFDSVEWPDIKEDSVGEPPETSQINKVYRELLLVTSNDHIAQEFMKFMNAKGGYCSPANRGKFINLLRADLGVDEVKIPLDSIPYFRNYRR